MGEFPVVINSKYSSQCLEHTIWVNGFMILLWSPSLASPIQGHRAEQQKRAWALGLKRSGPQRGRTNRIQRNKIRKTSQWSLAHSSSHLSSHSKCSFRSLFSECFLISLYPYCLGTKSRNIWRSVSRSPRWPSVLPAFRCSALQDIDNTTDKLFFLKFLTREHYNLPIKSFVTTQTYLSLLKMFK